MSLLRLVLLGGLLLLSLLLLHFIGEPGWADPKSAGWAGLWVSFLGGLHPVFLHLPIGGLMVVFLMELVNVFSFGRYRTDTLIPLLFSLGTCLPALWFGYALYLTGSYTGELIERHKFEGLVFCALLVICVLFKLALRRFSGRGIALRLGYGTSLLASVVLMTLAGHHGGLITHGDPMEQWPADVLAEREEAAEALRGDPVIYEHVVQPILEERCVYCHDEDKQEGGLRLDSYAALLQGGEHGPGLVAGDIENSSLVTRMLLPLTEEKHMPPTEKPQPTEGEIALLQWWVGQGASQDKKKSELSVPDAIGKALADLVSPAERKAREAALRQEQAEQNRLLLAERERLKPLLAAFNARFPGALGYVSSEAPDLNFTAVSYASSFGLDDMESLLPFADVLVSADFSRSAIADSAVVVISQLTALRELNLSQTGVSDAFIAGLVSLQQLELLNAYGTRVGPGSEASLLQLPALRTLFIGNSEYGAEETVALRDALRESHEHAVQVVGVDALPELALLTEEDVRQTKDAPAASAAALPGNAWLPNQLGGLFLWLDADDASTVRVASGGVSQWDDKSGKGHHAYALDPDLRPVAENLRLNGRNALKFFESQLANREPASGNWQDVFVVADWNGGPAFDNFNGLLTGFAGRLGIIGDSRGEGKGLYLPETWWQHLRINGRVHDGSNAMTLLAQPFVANIFADEPAKVDGFSIGMDRQFTSKGNSRDWEGAVCELIAFERKLSDEERSRVEAYLAHKWGLKVALPENHLYPKLEIAVGKSDEDE